MVCPPERHVLRVSKGLSFMRWNHAPKHALGKKLKVSRRPTEEIRKVNRRISKRGGIPNCTHGLERLGTDRKLWPVSAYMRSIPRVIEQRSIDVDGLGVRSEDFCGEQGGKCTMVSGTKHDRALSRCVEEVERVLLGAPETRWTLGPASKPLYSGRGTQCGQKETAHPLR